MEHSGSLPRSQQPTGSLYNIS